MHQKAPSEGLASRLSFLVVLSLPGVPGHALAAARWYAPPL